MAVKREIMLQFKGQEVDEKAIVEKAIKAYKEEKNDAVKSVKIYAKPEEDAAYYVINEKSAGKVSLF